MKIFGFGNRWLAAAATTAIAIVCGGRECSPPSPSTSLLRLVPNAYFTLVSTITLHNSPSSLSFPQHPTTAATSGGICCMNCQVHQVEVELSSWDHLPDSVRIVLHSILFLRSVGKVSHPKQAQCRPHTSLCYAKLSQFDPQVERAVDLLLRQPPADASTLVLSFYEKKPKTAGLYSLLGAGEEMVYFERFFVSFKLDPVLDLKREEVLLRKVVFRLASVGNVKLLPYSFRGEHPLFEITLQPQPQQQQLPQSQFEDKPPAWFAGLFG